MRWLKFNAVGGLGIGVQLAVLTLLHAALGLDYLIATACAVEAAVLHNFFWHERWTWLDRTGASSESAWRRLGRFNLTTGMVSVGGNLLLMYALVSGLGVPPLAANLATIAICALANYLASDRLVFRSPAEERDG